MQANKCEISEFSPKILVITIFPTTSFILGGRPLTICTFWSASRYLTDLTRSQLLDCSQALSWCFAALLTLLARQQSEVETEPVHLQYGGPVKVPDSFMNSEESHNLTLETSTRSECDLTSDKETMMSKTELGKNTNQNIYLRENWNIRKKKCKMLSFKKDGNSQDWSED